MESHPIKVGRFKLYKWQRVRNRWLMREFHMLNDYFPMESTSFSHYK